ncbi:MAG: VanZ family protein [Dethiobacter sp.]|jgi:glycopeptide antibiotics resistance protein|nr:VanZ family protein [Dethiobacter sp.]MBS3989448.1 VanZ family protein [Dethiobacter sp.]
MDELRLYVKAIVCGLEIDQAERKDLADELLDHLTLLKERYLEEGFSEKDSVSMTIKTFGDRKKLSNSFYSVFSPYNHTIRTIIFICTAIYLIFIFLNFFYRPFHGIFSARPVNMVPFSSISHFLFNATNLNFNVWFNNTIGITVAFIPFGFLLPLYFNKINKARKIVLYSALFCLIIEGAQFLSFRGVADIDDVILGTIGSVLGYFLLLKTKKTTKVLKHKNTDNCQGRETCR